MDNRETFNKLYDTYWLDIRKFIYVQARRDNGYTEEIFQNTWENVWRYLHTLQEFASARAWIYRIAANEAKRYFANRRIRMFPVEGNSRDGDSSPISDAEMLQGFAAEPEDAEAARFPEQFADRQLLRQLLSRLSEDEQQLVLLHYAYDMRLSEIADLYNMNYNTLKSMTRRAITRLRALAKEMPEV